MVYGKMDAAGNGSLSKNNWLIYDVWWEQGSAGLPECVAGAWGLSSPPSRSCSACVWTNPLSSRMPRKQSSVSVCVCVRMHAHTHTHTHTHITAWEIPTSGSHVTELCPGGRSWEGLEDRGGSGVCELSGEHEVNPLAPQLRDSG